MSRFKIRYYAWSRLVETSGCAVPGRPRTALCAATWTGATNPSPISLPYTNGFLVTGNFGLATVDLPNTSSSSGFLTGTINISQTEVPNNSHILAAFLFWETITSADPALGQQELAGVKFRGLGVDVVNVASDR